MKKRILIIDDEEILTKTFAKLLEKADYEVLIGKSATDCMVITQEESFDLIITDIRMPGLDGVSAIEKIRGEGCDSPVIFVTGYADPELEKRAKKIARACMIHKPFDTTVLLEKVRSIVGK